MSSGKTSGSRESGGHLFRHRELPAAALHSLVALAVLASCALSACTKSNASNGSSAVSASAPPVTDSVALVDSPWTDSSATAAPDYEVPDQLFADSAGGILVMGRTVKVATTVHWVRRYLADGHIDQRFSTRSIQASAIHGFKPMHAAAVMPSGETQLITDAGDALGVSPDGEWRQLSPPAKAAPSASWVRIQGRELDLSASASGDVKGRLSLASTLGPEQSIETLGA